MLSKPVIMKSDNTYIIHPETEEQENALKAFVSALKMKFEVAQGKDSNVKDEESRRRDAQRSDAHHGDALHGDALPYDPDFVARVHESQQQAKEGKITRIEKDKLKDFLGLT